MVIIVGHTRLKAAEKLKLETVPVLIAKDLSEKKAREYRIADNKTNEFAEWDFPELKFELEDLDLDWLEFEKKESKDFEEFTDLNCEMPIIPEYDEKYDIFIIVSNSAVNSNYFREKYNFKNMKSYKNGEKTLSNVIKMEDFLNES